MNSNRRSEIFLVALVALCLAFAERARGLPDANSKVPARPKTSVKTLGVFALSSSESVLDRASEVLGRSSPGGVVQALDEFRGQLFDKDGRARLDPERPLGVVFLAVGKGPEPILFLPVKTEAGVLEFLHAYFPSRIRVEAGLYRLSRSPEGRSFYLRLGAAWATLGRQPDHPGADGLSLDAVSTRGHDIAATVNPRHWPASFGKVLEDLGRDLALRQSLADGGDAAPGRQLAQLVYPVATLLGEVSELTVGVTLSKETQDVTLDIEARLPEQSESADTIAALGHRWSGFASLHRSRGLLSLTVTSASSPLTRKTIGVASSLLREYLHGVHQEKLRGDLKRLNEWRRSWRSLSAGLDREAARLKEAEFDLLLGLERNAKTGFLTAVAAANWADTGFLKSWLRDNLPLYVELELFEKGSLSERSHDGVEIFSMRPRKFETSPLVRFGKSPVLHVGVSRDSVYLLFGEAGVETLKTAIDSSGRSPPGRKAAGIDVHVSLTRLREVMGRDLPSGKGRQSQHLLHFAIGPTARGLGIQCKLDPDSLLQGVRMLGELAASRMQGTR